MAVQIPPSMGSGNFEWGKGRPIVKYRTLCGHLGKNDRTNRDAVWAMGSDGPKESCAKWGPDRHGKGQFWGKGAPIVKYRDTAVTCTKTAEPIDLPFGLWSRVGRRSTSSIIFARWRRCAHMGGQLGATWRIRFNRTSATTMRSYVKLL